MSMTREEIDNVMDRIFGSAPVAPGEHTDCIYGGPECDDCDRADECREDEASSCQS